MNLVYYKKKESLIRTKEMSVITNEKDWDNLLFFETYVKRRVL